MLQNIANIRKELAPHYSKEEIQGFILHIFHDLKSYSLTDLVCNKEKSLSENEHQTILNIIEQLKKNVPIQYILGKTEFMELDFEVNPSVLIPRPETEELVQWLIDDFQTTISAHVFDACTGSGCVAISVAKQIPNARVYACDISKEALATAERNAKNHAANVNFFELDILNSSNFKAPHKFDAIISNPPYVLEMEKQKMNDNVLQHEPHIALFVADDKALMFYEAIADFALIHLKRKGCIYFEINEQFGTEMKQMLLKKGFEQIELKQDVFRKDRMIKAILK
ncbi:MAG: peptide chain release factor N(5)-glutamine methyltransferase [Mangrovibacterium sp.]